MDDAFGVCGIEGVGNIDGEAEKTIGLNWTSGDGVLEGDAIMRSIAASRKCACRTI